ncbi:NAD(P)-binding protein [Nonomuraea sp. MCN248]|uniref:NAD(P)-binding protein n=1 Tax=Nonomuraea corallina TaxID=2989783 RepID=A0ABT4S4J0_9ACTN|nr:NAD(P)-binding protein [Nonomuraea corallina]MDA0631815.1 NAD(P)-binding protein [Nonomuraea corallina]
MGDIGRSAAGRELGMRRAISRRDFFDGVAVTAGVAAVGVPEAAGTAYAAASAPAPAGFHGGTSQALSVLHALRDGRFWQHADPPVPTGESYDLVVVGAGLSGVSAAHEWLRRHPRARVLILDNHEVAGGHAQRPGSGWTAAPASWTPEFGELLDRLGLAATPCQECGADDSVMCDRETFPVETLVSTGAPVDGWIGRLPVADDARADLLRLYAGGPDPFPGLSPEDKQERLAGLTYSRYLLETLGVHPDAERFCRTMPSAAWGYDARALGAVDAWGLGYPGFAGLGLDAGKPSPFNAPTVAKEWGTAGRVAHLPGGLHGLLRAMLDGLGRKVRLRLSSPVVSVRNDGPAETAASATVGYFDGHEVRSVGAGAVILACWHAVVPHLVPDLPGDQREALRAAVKTPLVEAVVRLRSGDAWRRLGVARTRWTGAYWSLSELVRHSGDGVTARLVAAPCRSELGPAEGSAAGRQALLRTPYETLEFSARDQLARLLGPAGFDPGRDVEAVAVYRWGHGYSPEYCRPWHAFHPDGPSPAETARRRFGRIALAGSDSAPAARADAAVTAACRAVRELAG